MRKRHPLGGSMARKILFLIGLMITVNESAISQIKFGLQAGDDLAYQHLEYQSVIAGNSSFNKKMIPAFHVGITSQIKISGKIDIQPALLFIRKGSKYYFPSSGITVEQKIFLSYIELRTPAVYNIPGRELIYFIGAGPEIAYGVSGKLKQNTAPEDLGLFDSIFERIDGGMVILAGLKKNRWQASLDYDLGLVNTFQNRSSSKNTNHVFGLSLIYYLWELKN